MKKNVQQIISIFTLAFFVFIAFGSEDDENTTTETLENTQEIKEDNLTQAQKDSIELVKTKNREKGEKELKSFKKNEDEFEGSAFYRDPRTPYYSNVNFIYPYIGKKENQYWLRLKFQYNSDDWLFIERAILMIDGEKYTVTGNWERDNNSDIWEWLDLSVEENELLILEKLVNSKDAKVRYEGRQYHNDRTISSKEKSIIKKTLEIYNNKKKKLLTTANCKNGGFWA